MNLFLIGHRPGEPLDTAQPRGVLERLLARLPFFPGRPVESWASADGTVAAAWVRHSEEMPYAAEGDGALALFSGRPFRWVSDAEADGRGPADASFFLGQPPTGDLDGRFAAVVFDGSELRGLTDPVGAYPLFETTGDGTRWLSNNPTLLREVGDGEGYDAEALAGLLGGGWPLDGHPIWRGVRRTGLTAPRVTPGGGLDAEGAAARLVAATRALGDWPGRPNVVPVTGGRDSRVVLAAALAAGLDFGGLTGGAPDDPDVVTGRELCLAAGVPHSLLGADPGGDMWTNHRRAAEVLRLTAGGTASLADAAGFPLSAREGPLPLWHSGQGGEIGRSYYGSGEELDAPGLERRLYDAFTGRRAHRRELLSDAGRELVSAQIRGWVAAKLDDGASAADVPDLFYVERRMATWAAPSHGCVEYIRDTTSPLWSRRVVDDLLAPPAGERSAAPYHREVVRRLAPQLEGVPFAAPPQGASLPRKAVRELRRRLRPRPDGFQPIVDDVREQALAADSHPAWEVLDRARCEALLSRPAGSLDAMSRYYVWRLATVFAGES